MNWGNHHGWLATELEPNRKLFPDHLPFILLGELGGCFGSLWPFTDVEWVQMEFKSSTQTLVEIELSYYKREPISAWCSMVTHIGAKLTYLSYLDQRSYAYHFPRETWHCKVLTGEHDHETYKEEGLLHSLLKSRRDLGVKSKGYSRTRGALQIIIS
jgi:hypothetical protein